MLPDPSQWYYVGKCKWCGAALYEQGGRYQWKDGGFDCLHEVEDKDTYTERGEYAKPLVSMSRRTNYRD